MMLLSILVAVYNEEEHIRRCLNSVCNQNLSEFELIIVDDGSTDCTFDICIDYATVDSRISVYHKENGGLISARMKGINMAQGDFITFLDGDDWIDCDLYEKLIIPMVSDAEIDISISAYSVDTDAGEQKYKFIKSSPRIMTSKTALIEMFSDRLFNWSGCGKIYRKCIVEGLCDKWWSLNSFGEDTEWNYKAFSVARKIYYSAECGYHYYMNADSMMHKELSMEQLFYIDRMERIITDIDRNSVLFGMANELLTTYCLNTLLKLYQSNRIYEQEIEKCLIALRASSKWVTKPFADSIGHKMEFVIWGKEKYQSIIRNNIGKLYEAYNELINETDDIYIYGAGVIGKWVAECLTKKKLKYKGFVISSECTENSSIMMKYVFSISDIDDYNSKAFLVASNKKNEIEIMGEINARGICHYKNVGKYSIWY